MERGSPEDMLKLIEGNSKWMENVVYCIKWEN